MLLNETIGDCTLKLVSERKLSSAYPSYTAFLNEEQIVSCLELGEALLVLGIAFKLASAAGRFDSDTVAVIKDQIIGRTPRLTDKFYRKYAGEPGV